jgi:hypothetical protein
MNSEYNLFLGPIYANWKSVLIQRVGIDFCSRELVLHCISLVIGVFQSISAYYDMLLQSTKKLVQ